LWSRSIDESPAFGEGSRVSALYNLGRFYSRIGHGVKALPYFRQSFELDPRLRELARKDPDLDTVRGDDDYASLLGG
jgi:hypothetical protein